MTTKSRKLAAIMFTDIVGYSAIMHGDESRAAKIRERHRQVFHQRHTQHQGDIIQYYGDGTLSIFSSAVQAVECAMDILNDIKEGETIVPLRIGLHLGDIVYSDIEVYGDGVNVASRIENLSVGGAILLSGKINDELKNHKHITTRSIGAFVLKNISAPVEIFMIRSRDIVGLEEERLVASIRDQIKVAPRTKSIAVVPFVNMSASKDNEYFSDGMTEEMINALAQIKGLKVTSRTSSFYFKNKDIPIPQIGRELNVSTILEGSIRLAGNTMRITVQLIDVINDVHIWSETFDRQIDDIFKTQDEISLHIADKLRAHLGHLDVEGQLVIAPGISVEHYQQYLKSRYYILKMNGPDIELGISLLRKVIEDNPKYALAHLGMHLGYTLLGTLGIMPAMEAFVKAKPYLDTAIAMEPDLVECQLQLSWIAFLLEWDVESAYRHLRKSYEIRPTVDFYQSMASILVAEGKLEAALHYLETAMELDPFSEINCHLVGYTLYLQEKYAEAIVYFDKGISLKPDSHVSILYRGQALLLQGHAKEALAYFKQLPDEKDDLVKLGGVTMAYAALDQRTEANEGIAKLTAALQGDSMDRALNLLILCKAAMGDEEETLVLIRKGIEMRLPMMVYMGVEPMLKRMRAVPLFNELMERVLNKPFDR